MDVRIIHYDRKYWDAAHKVLHDKKQSKKSKTKRGEALVMKSLNVPSGGNNE